MINETNGCIFINKVNKFLSLQKIQRFIKDRKVRNNKYFQIGETCDKLYDVKDVKVRDYCRVTSKYESSAQKKFNVNFRLTFKVPVIFHNAR